MRFRRLLAVPLTAWMLALVLSVPGCGEGEETEVLSPAEEAAQIEEDDANAIRAVRAARAALDQYASTNDGSYGGVTPEALIEIEPILANVNVVTLSAHESDYVVGVMSASGAEYQIERPATGNAIHSCLPMGESLCDAKGYWD